MTREESTEESRNSAMNSSVSSEFVCFEFDVTSVNIYLQVFIFSAVTALNTGAAPPKVCIVKGFPPLSLYPPFLSSSLISFSL